MAVDITNHLIPYTQVKRMLEQAWGEGYEAGIAAAKLRAEVMTHSQN